MEIINRLDGMVSKDIITEETSMLNAPPKILNAKMADAISVNAYIPTQVARSFLESAKLYSSESFAELEELFLAQRVIGKELAKKAFEYSVKPGLKEKIDATIGKYTNLIAEPRIILRKLRKDLINVFQEFGDKESIRNYILAARTELIKKCYCFPMSNAQQSTILASTDSNRKEALKILESILESAEEANLDKDTMIEVISEVAFLEIGVMNNELKAA